MKGLKAKTNSIGPMLSIESDLALSFRDLSSKTKSACQEAKLLIKITHKTNL